MGVGINGGLENYSLGQFNEQLSYLISYTIRLFSQFNIVLNSLP